MMLCSGLLYRQTNELPSPIQRKNITIMPKDTHGILSTGPYNLEFSIFSFQPLETREMLGLGFCFPGWWPSGQEESKWEPPHGNGGHGGELSALTSSSESPKLCPLMKCPTCFGANRNETVTSACPRPLYRKGQTLTLLVDRRNELKRTCRSKLRLPSPSDDAQKLPRPEEPLLCFELLD